MQPLALTVARLSVALIDSGKNMKFPARGERDILQGFGEDWTGFERTGHKVLLAKDCVNGFQKTTIF